MKSHSNLEGIFFLVPISISNIVKNGRFNIVEHSDNSQEGGQQQQQTTSSEVSTASESVSRFHIAPILDQDSGEISCEVANRFGRDSKTFLLSIEGGYNKPLKEFYPQHFYPLRFAHGKVCL